MWLPFLSTDLRRRSSGPDSRPLVLVEKQQGALRLAALDAAAREAGLRQGMTLSEARALLPALAAADLDRNSDRRALARCADAALRFTPLVALDGADGLMLDITGCAHLFGDEEGLLKASRRLMRRLGLSARARIASTPEAARAFARFAPPGTEGTAARRLPVQALEADEETERALIRAGFRTLGDLADRPTQILAARFGEAATGRLRCILGQKDRRITPLRPPPDIMAERHFPEPLAAADGLLGMLERLARNVAGSLERRGEGGRLFEATFFRSDGAVRRVAVGTALGTRDAARLIRLFRLRIEALSDPLDPGFGFDAMRLAVVLAEPLEMRQDDLAGAGAGGDEAAAVAGLVDRLAARFGPENVRRLVAGDSHDPVRAAASVRFDAPARCGAPSAPAPGEPPARPLTLFDRPQPIEALAEVPDGPPIRFRWRRVLHEVARAEGPERIAPEWWRPKDAFPAIRDYYRVEDAEGRRYWLFRQGFYTPEAHPRWYVHGLFA